MTLTLLDPRTMKIHMKRILAFLPLLLSCIVGAQDTTVVHTLTFDSITTRRGWWEFPPAGEQFRKVLMVHTLKCDPQTTQDQYPCGEWDYLTYHFIHEHTGMLDSSALQHPYFKVGAATPPSAISSSFQGIDLRQRWLRTDELVSVTNEVNATVGTNDAVDAGTFANGGYFGRSQFLYTASELSAAGLVAGPINLLRFHPNGGPGGWIPKLIIRMAPVTTSTIPTFQETGLVTVFRGQDLLDVLDGLVLHQPFTWDGTSHILVDVAVEEIGGLEGVTLEATPVPTGTCLQEIGRDGYVELNNDFLGVAPEPLATLDDVVTVTFRAYGAPQLPLSTTILEAVNATGQRVLNIHLPWENGRVYWDAGNDGGGYDRIDKAAAISEYEGRWNNWAFVKNASTGSMRIYLNGVLWHNGTGKTKPLSGIVRMRLGSDANGGNAWPGLLDEVCVFNAELSAATIAAWHDKKVDALHPDHTSLLYQFSLDEPAQVGSPLAINTVDGAHPAWLMGTVRRDERECTFMRHAATDPGLRPVLTFVQGDHVVAPDSSLVTFPDRYPRPLLSREIFAVQGNTITPVDTIFGFSGGWTYTLDPQGIAIDSTELPNTVHVNDTLNYFGVPFEVINDHEIGRYITPYGIGLDLGPEGFSWVYDVTDHQHLLQDSVELSAGNQQELIDLTFLMIEGDAPRPVVNVQRPWGSMRSYSYASLDDDTGLPPVTVGTHADATQWMLRSRLTGHGHNSNDGSYPHCCEWKDNTHYLTANGQAADQWHIWQENDCANNPVYPQGGTWLGSREGWCPGDLVKDRDTELTSFVTSDSITLDYAITPVPQNNLGMGGGNYVINMDLFEYGPAAHAIDAEIHDVRRPNNSGYRSRENPICNNPVIVLRNAGSTALSSVTFQYSVSGGEAVTFNWAGDLGHMERTEVSLPVGSPQFWAGHEERYFHVAIVDVNGGGADMYADNDAYRTRFELPVIYPDNFVLHYRTNARPQENDLFVRDMDGNIVHSRTTFTANTQYRDTLELAPGCYELEFTDSGNDGLSYWADPDAGNGWFRFRSLQGQIMRTFEPEFGNRIHAAFGIGTITGMEDVVNATAFAVHPNPSNDVFTLTASDLSDPAPFVVTDITGRVVRTGQMIPWESLRLDLGGERSGVYVVRIAHDRTTTALRLMKQ